MHEGPSTSGGPFFAVRCINNFRRASDVRFESIRGHLTPIFWVVCGVCPREVKSSADGARAPISGVAGLSCAKKSPATLPAYRLGLLALFLVDLVRLAAAALRLGLGGGLKTGREWIVKGC